MDDHDIVRHGLKIALAGEDNLQIIGEAKDGQTAIELCQQLSPHVVLMDMVMPGMDGLEATRAIRKENPDIQIIVLTSFENETSVQDVLSSGAISYLAKDLSVVELIDAIQRAHNREPTISKVLVENLKRPPASRT